jgi:hypothetical protein
MSEWLGLLRWSIAVNDGTLPSNASAMSAEDRAWLERVMQEGVRDDPKRMNEVMLAFKEYLNKETHTATDEDVILDQLVELRDIVEQIDMAHVFAKFGGVDVFTGVLESRAQSVQLRAVLAAILATVAQNNVMVQNLMQEKGLVIRLSAAFMTENEEKILNKLLFALSASIRGHPAAEEAFVLGSGSEVLFKALSWRSVVTSTPQNSSLSGRALFLSSALLSSDFASAECLARLAEVLLPLTLLKEPMEEEEADLALHALHDLAKTSRGHELLRGDLRGQLEAFLQRVCNPVDGHGGDKQGQRLLIEQLINAPYTPRAPPQVAPVHDQTTAVGVGGGDAEDGNNTNQGGGGNVLLIEPPPLIAASRIP